MDQIAVDLTGIAGNEIGCGVELISANSESKATLEKIAYVAGVVPHAIISRISPKVHRTYLDFCANISNSLQREHPLQGRYVH
jgi:alanine racemase